MRKVFLEFLPKVLCMQRPLAEDDDDEDSSKDEAKKLLSSFADVGFGEKTLILAGDERRSSNNSLNGSNDFPPPPPPEKLNIPGMIAPHPSDSSDPFANGINKDFTLPSYNIAEGDPFTPEAVSPIVESINGDGNSIKKMCAEVERAILGVRFVAQHHKNLDNYLEVRIFRSKQELYARFRFRYCNKYYTLFLKCVDAFAKPISAIVLSLSLLLFTKNFQM